MRSKAKSYIIYCSMVPMDFPPDWLFVFAKKLSDTMPVLFIELTQGNRPKKSRWQKIKQLVTFIFSNRGLHIWEYWSPIANYTLFIKLLILKLFGYNIILITTSSEYRPIYNFIPHDYSFFDCTDQYISKEFKQNATRISLFDTVFINSNYMGSKIALHNPNTVTISTGYIKNRYQRDTKRKLKHSILFVGGISRRVDFELLSGVITLLPHYSFFFVGEIYLNKYYAGTGKTEKKYLSLWDNLLKHPNTYYLGAFPYKETQQLIDLFQIGIIPYRTNNAMNMNSHPIKFYEYLLHGLPIVSTPLPILMEKKAAYPVFFANNARGFSQKIVHAMNMPKIAFHTLQLYNDNAITTKVSQVMRHIKNHVR